MRIAAMGLVGALALVATAANAAPSVPAPAGEHNIIAVADGCGWGLHPNRWGDCVPNRYGYRRAYRHWDGFYGGGDGYEPWNRPSPTDHIANELNRRQLYGGF